MSVVCTVAVPVTTFRLGRALRAPETHVELERTVQRDASLAVWIWTDDDADYLETLERRGVAVDRVESVDGGLRCSVDRFGGVDGPRLLDTFREADLTLLSGRGDDRCWEFHARASTAGDLKRFRQLADERSIDVDVTRRTAGGACGTVAAALTAVQRETLVAAHREGYYSTPRTATLADLGDRFDVSPRAVSQRLRRGVGNLVAATLPTDPEEPPLVAEK